MNEPSGLSVSVPCGGLAPRWSAVSGLPLGLVSLASTPGAGDGQRGVLWRRVAVVVGDRRLAGCAVDGEADRGGVAVDDAVVGLVGEAVGAGEAGVGRVGERAVGVERQRAVGRAGDHDGRVSGSPSASVSLPSTPGAAMVSVVFCGGCSCRCRPPAAGWPRD